MSDTTQPRPHRRRLLTGLGVLAVGGWVWGVPRLSGLFPADLAFTDMPSAPGFRRLETNLGGLSASVLSGVEDPDPVALAALNTVKSGPCAALYGQSPGAVPIALFSDFNCPNCPAMDRNVLNVVGANPQTSLHRHELPLLGRTSVTASQAVLAADRQGKYAEMHDALRRTPAVTDLTFVKSVATRVGVDPDRLVADMAHPDITGALAKSKALAQYLGLIGTPATVIGYTVVLGVQSEATLNAIIAQEEERGGVCS